MPVLYLRAMYNPKHFEATDLKTLHAIIRQHPFALLITQHEGELQLSHIPFHLDAAAGANGTLEAHVARANPHCAAIQAGAPSTVVFKGAHGYVSPRWYVDPAHNVPTWNYVAVHAHGAPQPINERDATLAMIGRLTDEHEAYIDKPWSVEEAQPYAEKLSGGILAFRFPIERLEGKLKLSQNRQPQDRVRVIAEFRKSAQPGAGELVELMDALYNADGSLKS